MLAVVYRHSTTVGCTAQQCTEIQYLAALEPSHKSNSSGSKSAQTDAHGAMVVGVEPSAEWPLRLGCDDLPSSERNESDAEPSERSHTGLRFFYPVRIASRNPKTSAIPAPRWREESRLTFPSYTPRTLARPSGIPGGRAFSFARPDVQPSVLRRVPCGTGHLFRSER